GLRQRHYDSAGRLPRGTLRAAGAASPGRRARARRGRRAMGARPRLPGARLRCACRQPLRSRRASGARLRGNRARRVLSPAARVISLVIPAYNEARLLPRLLDSVDAPKLRYDGGVQVIVADNSSTDATATLALRRGCDLTRVEKRCIAAARNGGA